jgi:hypothetical protein
MTCATRRRVLSRRRQFLPALRFSPHIRYIYSSFQIVWLLISSLTVWPTALANSISWWRSRDIFWWCGRWELHGEKYEGGSKSCRPEKLFKVTETTLQFFNIVSLYFNAYWYWYINLTIDGAIYPSQHFPFGTAFVCQAGNFWTYPRTFWYISRPDVIKPDRIWSFETLKWTTLRACVCVFVCLC